jgi:ribosome-binding protein aMBF1 (putative translation factor)
MENYEAFKKEFFKKRPKAKQLYDELEPEYALIRAIIKKRIEKKMTQATLAKKMGTKQSVISRLESGNANPTLSFMREVATALGSELTISLK